MKIDQDVARKQEVRLDARIQRELDALSELLARKNADYGDAAFQRPTLVDISASGAILVRIDDKIKRLQHLAFEPANVVMETFDDTIRDLAGYCILYLSNRSQSDTN